MSDVAKTILQQLGGKRFVAMTGARNFIAGTVNDLSFRLPGSGGFCKNGINAVTIVLMGDDTYTISFRRIRADKVKVVSTHAGVYAEQLRAIFRSETGLETSL